MRVVLYAEGAGDATGAVSLPPETVVPLAEDQLGPAHFLVRRAIAQRRSAPVAAVTFEGPLLHRARTARGRDLAQPKIVRQLLSWPKPSARPDLAVVLVDCDAQPARRGLLERALDDVPVTHVVAMPVQEFEAWLIADMKTVRAVLGAALPSPPPPESMACRQAKDTLADWLGKARPPNESRAWDKAQRSRIADACDLALVARVCPSFDAFLRAL